MKFWQKKEIKIVSKNGVFKPFLLNDQPYIDFIKRIPSVEEYIQDLLYVLEVDLKTLFINLI